MSYEEGHADEVNEVAPRSGGLATVPLLSGDSDGSEIIGMASVSAGGGVKGPESPSMVEADVGTISARGSDASRSGLGLATAVAVDAALRTAAPIPNCDE